MLQSKAMITNLTVRQWTGQKTDKKIGEEVDKQHNAKNAGKYIKWLIDKIELEPLSKHSGKVRDLHYTMTLPWGDNGDRLLPSRMFMKYSEQMRNLRAEREKLAKEFAQKYPSMIASGAQRLGSMYNANDFPSPDDIEKRFGIDLAFLPVPDANDFRVDVSKEAVDEIKKNITESVEARQREAIKDCWTRMEDVVGKIAQRLVLPDAVFRDTLIENARFVAEVIPDLNIADDIELNRACEKLADLAAISPAVLRYDIIKREDTCRKAQNLLQIIAEQIRK
jgi:hypothetical protein